MPLYSDQTGRNVEIGTAPKRIITLVPSQTELLFDLGLDEEVIAITKFCVHPEKWFRSKTRIGGTKNLDIEKIRELDPDLVIANKEENVKEQIEEIEKFCPVWISDVHNLQSALGMISSIAEITGKKIEGDQLISNVRKEFEKCKPGLLTPACYLIWKDPMMTVGGDTFISEMMKLAGLRNVYNDQLRYPEIRPDDLKSSEASVILLSTEPYPYKEGDVLSFKYAFPDKKVLLVDGEMFSWYGSRMLKAAGYFRDIFPV